MLLRSPACWTIPVTTSVTRSTYSSYIIARSASRIRCWMTCLAVCAAMRPKFSGVTSARFTWSAGTSDQSMSRSSSRTRVWLRSPFSTSASSSSVIARSRASSISRSSMSAGSSTAQTRKSPLVVELDLRVARCAGGLLVGGEQGVLERVDEGVFLDPLLALDLPDCFQNLSAHLVTLRRSDCRARSRRTARRCARCRRPRRSPRSSPASTISPLNFDRPSIAAPCGAWRACRPRPRSARGCAAAARSPAKRPRASSVSR